MNIDWSLLASCLTGTSNQSVRPPCLDPDPDPDPDPGFHRYFRELFNVLFCARLCCSYWLPMPICGLNLHMGELKFPKSSMYLMDSPRHRLSKYLSNQ